MGCCGLGVGARLVGATLLTLTLALYAAYLVWLEDIRLRLLDGEYGLQQCYVPPVDTLIDSAFEYSVVTLYYIYSTNPLD